MNDKTPLERDIEQHEMYDIPVSVKILIILLVSGLFIAGLYAVNLKQDLLQQKREMAAIKNKLQKERLELIGEMQRLKAETETHSQHTEEPIIHDMMEVKNLN